jgi:hypothetical protein
VLHAHLKAKHPNYTGPTNVPTASATADGENSPTHALAAGAAGNGTDVPDLATKHDPADDSASSRASSRTSHDAMGQLDRSVVAALLGIMVDNRFVSFSADDLFMRLQQLPAAQLAPASPDNLLAALQRDGNFLVFTYSNDDLTAIANRAGVGLSHVTPRLGGRRIAVPGANHAAADATYFQKDAMQRGTRAPCFSRKLTIDPQPAAAVITETKISKSPSATVPTPQCPFTMPLCFATFFILFRGDRATAMVRQCETGSYTKPDALPPAPALSCCLWFGPRMDACDKRARYRQRVARVRVVIFSRHPQACLH